MVKALVPKNKKKMCRRDPGEVFQGAPVKVGRPVPRSAGSIRAGAGVSLVLGSSHRVGSSVVTLDVWLQFYYMQDATNAEDLCALEYRCNSKRESEGEEQMENAKVARDGVWPSQLPSPLALPPPPRQTGGMRKSGKVYRSFFRFVFDPTNKAKDLKEKREDDTNWEKDHRCEEDKREDSMQTMPLPPSRWQTCKDERAQTFEATFRTCGTTA